MGKGKSKTKGKAINEPSDCKKRYTLEESLFPGNFFVSTATIVVHDNGPVQTMEWV